MLRKFNKPVSLWEHGFDLLQISDGERFSQHLLDSYFELLKCDGLLSVM